MNLSVRHNKRGPAVCCRAAATGVCECAEGHCIRRHTLEGTHLTHFFPSMVPRTQNTPRFCEYALFCFEAAVVELPSPILFNLVLSIHVALAQAVTPEPLRFWVSKVKIQVTYLTWLFHRCNCVDLFMCVKNPHIGPFNPAIQAVAFAEARYLNDETSALDLQKCIYCHMFSFLTLAFLGLENKKHCVIFGVSAHIMAEPHPGLTPCF